ncbi:unnamed protein product [Leuciscus chuanchicus]
MARRQTLISEIANDARTARLEPTLMKASGSHDTACRTGLQLTVTLVDQFCGFVLVSLMVTSRWPLSPPPGRALHLQVPVLWGFQGGTSARQPESLGSISADSPQTENSNLGWRSAGGGLALWLSRGPKIERNVLL